MVAISEQTYKNATAVTRRANPFRFDPLFAALSRAAAITVLVLLAGIMISMVYGGWDAFAKFGTGFFTGTQWDTMNDNYGGLPAIVGTLSTALIAMVIGVPLSMGTAIYLTQLAPGWFKGPSMRNQTQPQPHPHTQDAAPVPERTLQELQQDFDDLMGEL
jgi:phosphate transport system permease protein